MVFVSIDNSIMSKRVFMDVLHDNGNSNHGHIHGLSCNHKSQFSWSSLAMEHISHGSGIHPPYSHGQLLFSWFTSSINLWSQKSMVKFMPMAHGQPHGFFTQGIRDLSKSCYDPLPKNVFFSTNLLLQHLFYSVPYKKQFVLLSVLDDDGSCD